MNEVQQEVQRIRDLADRLYSDYPGEPEWEKLLACLLRRLPAEYFNREPHDRQTMQQLLTPDLKEKAMMMHQLVGISDIPDLLKHRVCGACETFLRRIGVDAAEIKKLKKSFDPRAINIFEGLEA
jgi:hypothetical protein